MMILLTRDDLLRTVSGLSEPMLDACLEKGWVRPTRTQDGTGDTSEEEMFLEIDAARLRLILELQRDFAVNDEAMPVVLSLVDQVHDLRRAVRRLVKELENRDKASRKPKRQIPVRPKTPPQP